METCCRPERLYLHLADRLQRVARADRRNFDCGLFRVAQAHAQRVGVVPGEGRISLHEWLQPRGAGGLGAGRVAELAGISGAGESASS